MSGILVASNSGPFAARLTQAIPAREAGQVRHWSSESADDGDLLRRMDTEQPEVVVLGPVTDEDAALRLCSALDLHHPGVSVLLVAPRRPELLERALRVGVRGVLDPDAEAETIHATVMDALETARLRRQAFGAGAATPANRRHLAVVLAAKGGTGKTTVSTNLAVALAREAPGEVVLVDLDLQFGDVATALGIEPEYTMANTLAMGDELDATIVKGMLTRHSSGLYVMCAPVSPLEADDLTADHVGSVLQLLSDQFRYVVVDTAAGIDEPALVALDHCTDIVLLTCMDVASIRATVKEIEALRMLGMETRRRHLVVNRANTKVGISPDDVEATLGAAIDVRVPSSREVPMSMNLGQPLVESDRRSPASRAFADLARRFGDDGAGQGDQPASRPWRARRKEVA